MLAQLSHHRLNKQMLDVALRLLALPAGHCTLPSLSCWCQPGCSPGLTWQQDQVGTAQGRADTASPELAVVTRGTSAACRKKSFSQCIWCWCGRTLNAVWAPQYKKGVEVMNLFQACIHPG